MPLKQSRHTHGVVAIKHSPYRISSGFFYQSSSFPLSLTSELPILKHLLRDALIMPLIRPRANRQPQKDARTIPPENTEAEETQKALTRLVNMLAARQMIVKIDTTRYKLAEMDKQIRLASEKGARGVVHVFNARNLEYDELTNWTKMLAEARLLLHDMKAESLLKALVCFLERLTTASVLFSKFLDVS